MKTLKYKKCPIPLNIYPSIRITFNIRPAVLKTAKWVVAVYAFTAPYLLDALDVPTVAVAILYRPHKVFLKL